MYSINTLKAINATEAKRRIARSGRVISRCSYLGNPESGIVLYDEPTKRTAYIRKEKDGRAFLDKLNALKTSEEKDTLILAQFL